MWFVLVLLEIFCLCLGGTIFLAAGGQKTSEAIANGIILGLVVLSLCFQTAFLLETPQLSILFELSAIAASIYLVCTKVKTVQNICANIQKFIVNHKIITAILIVCWLYLFLLAVIIPPANWDSMTYNLSRVYLFMQERSLFLDNVTTPRQAMFVVGSDILPYAFLRLGSDYGVGVFSFLAYISIAIGTYALARNYANVRVSLVTALIVLSMPQLCFQATSTKNDIYTAAAAVFCLIATHRFLAKANIKDLSLIVIGLTFGFAVKTTFAAFILPYLIVFGGLILFKVGVLKLFKIVKHNWLYFIVVTAPCLILSQLWLFYYNTVSSGDPTGNETIKIVQQPASQVTITKGAIPNLVRYLFQSFDWFPFDYIARGRLNFDLNIYLTQAYNELFKPIFGNNGIGMGYNKQIYPFMTTSLPHEDYAWYGILAFLIIIPSLFFSLYKGNAYLKATSLVLFSFIGIVSYTLVWTPWNNRYICLFFGAAGACIAFLLSKLPKQKIILKLITAYCIVSLVAAVTLNVSKPLGGLSITQFFQPNIWTKTNFGTDRLYYARNHFGDRRVEVFKQEVDAEDKVALITDDDSWIYHFYLVSPQAEIIPSSIKRLQKNTDKYDYVLCLDLECNLNQLDVNYTTVWQNTAQSKRLGRLIKLKDT